MLPLEGMQDVTRSHTIAVEPVTEPAQRPWHAEVADLLGRAARACIEHGIDIDAFMGGAWSAYVESRPGFKEALEEMQLRTQLDELRKAGKLGAA